MSEATTPYNYQEKTKDMQQPTGITDRAVEIFQMYELGRQVQKTQFDWLDNKNILTYRDEMVKRANGDVHHLNFNVETPVSFPIIARIAQSYVSKIAGNPVEMTVKSFKESKNYKGEVYQRQLSQALKAMLEWSQNTPNGNHQKEFQKKAYQTTIEGTCIEWEGFVDVRANRKIVDYKSDINNPKAEEKETVIDRGCRTKVRPLRNILIPNPYEEDIQKQSWIMDIEEIEYDIFKINYGDYDIGKVIPGQFQLPNQDTSSFREDYYQLTSSYTVQLFHYYDIYGNYTIMANGIIIYDGVNPYIHGKYPYSKTVYDIFPGVNFFYGKSFVEQISGVSDSYNTLYNLILEKQRLASGAFMLTENKDDFADVEEFEGGRVFEVESINSVSVQKFPGMDQSDINILNNLTNDAREIAGNPEGGAGATTPGGGKMLLSQTIKMEEEAKQTIGYHLNYLEHGERDRTLLRLSNLIQFLTTPERVQRGGVVHFKYQTVRAENQELSDGTRGTLVIKLIDDRQKKKEYDQIQRELGIEEAMENENIEAIAVSVNDLNQLQNEIQIVTMSSYEQLKSMEMQTFMQYMQLRLSILPQATDRQALIDKLDRILGYDNEDFNIDQDQLAQMGQEMQQRQQAEQRQAEGQEAELGTPNIQ